MFRSTGSVIYIPRSQIKWSDILFFYAKQYVLYTILKWLLRNAYLYVCNTFHDDSIIILKGKMGKYEQSTNSLTIEQLSKECLVMIDAQLYGGLWSWDSPLGFLLFNSLFSG